MDDRVRMEIVAEMICEMLGEPEHAHIAREVALVEIRGMRCESAKGRAYYLLGAAELTVDRP